MNLAAILWVVVGYIALGTFIINPLFKSLCDKTPDADNFLVLGHGSKYRYRSTTYIVVVPWAPLLLVWTVQMIVMTSRVNAAQRRSDSTQRWQ